MTQKLDDKITDAIKANLPAQIGETLQAELAALARLRADKIVIDSQLASAVREANNEHRRRELAEGELRKHSDLGKREDAVLLREQKQDLRDLEVKLYGQRHAEMLSLVGMVFKSPVYRQHVGGMVPVPVEGSPGANGSYPSAGFVLQSPVDVTTTRQAD